MILREALAHGTARLRVRDDLHDIAERDSSLLLRHVLQIDRAQMIAWPEYTLDTQDIAAFDAVLQRRLHAEPIQYITGVQEFYGREFIVSRDVLIPRPETELLVEELLKTVPDRNARLSIADVGTGSGAIAITLACELPHARIQALDLSPAALVVAQRNAEKHGVAHRIDFIKSDLMKSVKVDDFFHAIASNPPYVPFKERGTLHPQVSEHEPAMALFGGDDGFDIYRRLPAEAWRHLHKDGHLFMEIGERGPALDSSLSTWSDVRYIDDLQGLPRVVIARRA